MGYDDKCKFPGCRRNVSAGSGINYYFKTICDQCWGKLAAMPTWKAHKTMNVKGWQDEKNKYEKQKKQPKLVRSAVTIMPTCMFEEAKDGETQMDARTN